MKFSFFKTKSNVPKFSETTKFEENILKYFEQIDPFPSSPVTIHYVFTCTHGRTGVNFAAKLAEEGDEGSYSHHGNEKYIITGRSGNIKPDKLLLKQYLLNLAEKGARNNCVLSEWFFKT